jgi:hypothetical protein
MDDEVLVDDLDVAFVIIEQRFEGRTDLLAEGSSKLERLDHRDLGVLGSLEGGSLDVDGVDLARVGALGRAVRLLGGGARGASST